MIVSDWIEGIRFLDRGWLNEAATAADAASSREEPFVWEDVGVGAHPSDRCFHMAELSSLRRRMIEDITIRNLSPATQRPYIGCLIPNFEGATLSSGRWLATSMVVLIPREWLAKAIMNLFPVWKNWLSNSVNFFVMR